MRELTGNPDYLSLAESGELALRVSSPWPPFFSNADDRKSYGLITKQTGIIEPTDGG